MSTSNPTIGRGHGDIANQRALLRHAALCDSVGRQEFYLTHPVVCNTLQIATAPVRQVYEAVLQIIIHRTPGTPFIGDFRLGKTETISVVRTELQQVFPKLPSAVLVARSHDKPSEKAFFGDVLLDLKHGESQSGSAADRRIRLLRLVTSAAASLGSDRYIFFVDEGQNWGIQEYVWMRDFTNELKERGVRCTVIVFAHSELEALRDKVIGTKRTDLLGRFFLTPRAFRGLNNVAELRDTMAAFDNPERHEYPKGSGVCMTEFFLPLAYQQGWRLGDQADNLWCAFERVAAGRGRDAENIGMQWVMSAIRAVLFVAMETDCAGLVIDREIWAAAVGASEYESSLQ